MATFLAPDPHNPNLVEAGNYIPESKQQYQSRNFGYWANSVLLKMGRKNFRLFQPKERFFKRPVVFRACSLSAPTRTLFCAGCRSHRTGGKTSDRVQRFYFQSQ